MATKALIYLPHVSRTQSRVREFTRCKEHDNLLCYHGRALEVPEFNLLAPKVLLQAAIYGMQPIVKLVEVADLVPVNAAEFSKPAAPAEKGGPPTEEPAAAPPVATTPSEGAPNPDASTPPISAQVVIEPLNDGFMLVDLGLENAMYRGVQGSWESDASLVQPFASEDEAKAVLDEIQPPVVAPEKPAAKPAAPAKKAAKAKPAAPAKTPAA